MDAGVGNVVTSEDEKRAVWDVLVEICGASERMWPQFEYHFPGCREFRFQGDLGFGGKVWADRHRVYVTCYPEHETPAISAKIQQANAALAQLGVTS